MTPEFILALSVLAYLLIGGIIAVADGIFSTTPNPALGIVVFWPLFAIACIIVGIGRFIITLNHWLDKPIHHLRIWYWYGKHNKK